MEFRCKPATELESTTETSQGARFRTVLRVGCDRGMTGCGLEPGRGGASCARQSTAGRGGATAPSGEASAHSTAKNSRLSVQGTKKVHMMEAENWQRSAVEHAK